MYADRHARPEGIKPGSLIVAIAINAGLIGALLFVTPVFEEITREKPLVISNVPIDPPPEPVIPEAKPARSDRTAARPERVDTTTSILPTPSTTGGAPGASQGWSGCSRAAASTRSSTTGLQIAKIRSRRRLANRARSSARSRPTVTIWSARG